tara:strand:- start:864 stop:1403 length:540 start_codon:yes stop_codon:yes gene_type:complete
MNHFRIVEEDYKESFNTDTLKGDLLDKQRYEYYTEVLNDFVWKMMVSNKSTYVHYWKDLHDGFINVGDGETKEHYTDDINDYISKQIVNKKTQYFKGMDSVDNDYLKEKVRCIFLIRENHFSKFNDEKQRICFILKSFGRVMSFEDGDIMWKYRKNENDETVGIEMYSKIETIKSVRWV